MTVTVTLPAGGADRYMRFGDAYVKHDNGALDVVRNGARESYHYASEAWTTWKVTKRAGRRDLSGVDPETDVSHPFASKAHGPILLPWTMRCTVKGVGNPASPE